MGLPNEDELAAAISPQDVAAMRILQGALTVGPLLFLTITLALPMQAPPGPGVLRTEFLAVLVFMTLGAWGAALVLPGARYRALARRLHDAPPPDVESACAAWIAEQRGARILTLALLEGSALFGVVIVFLHRSSGVEPAQHPELWGALVPLLGFVLYSAATWPGPRAIASGWRRHVLEGA